MMPPADDGILRVSGPALRLVHAAVIGSYDPAALEQDLYLKLNQRLDVISAPGNFETVVMHMLQSAEREGWLRELLNMFCDSKYPGVKEAAARMLAAYPSEPVTNMTYAAVNVSPRDSSSGSNASVPSNTSAIADPYLCHLINQQPFIDRSALRVNLKDLLSESTSRVLVITGDRPCGKSYTWLFMSQPQLLTGIIPVLVDLSEWSEPTPPIEVMSSIALQLGLTEPKIDEHAQDAAQARRLRDWLVGQLQQHDRDGRWLLVFDSLDHVGQREETLQLIEFLAGAAIRQRLAGLRVVLLGYANRLAIDPLESVLTESIRDIGEPELRDFFRLLAQRVNVPMSDDAINVAVSSVLSLLPPEREPKLRQLPKTVRAVCNAAFGREVLP